jgi:hypothetical protein
MIDKNRRKFLFGLGAVGVITGALKAVASESRVRQDVNVCNGEHEPHPSYMQSKMQAIVIYMPGDDKYRSLVPCAKCNTLLQFDVDTLAGGKHARRT